MKLFYSILIFSSFACAMQDPKNMSREQLERAYKQALFANAQSQLTIAALQKTIHEEQAAFDLLWNLHYGDPVQREAAKLDLQQLRLTNFPINFKK